MICYLTVSMKALKLCAELEKKIVLCLRNPKSIFYFFEPQIKSGKVTYLLFCLRMILPRRIPPENSPHEEFPPGELPLVRIPLPWPATYNSSIGFPRIFNSPQAL